MDSVFWHERWQQNQIGFHQDEINAHLTSFWQQLDIPKGSRVFVPLCGKSSDMLWLRAEGYKVVGIELSPLAVESFFVENALEPEVEHLDEFARWSCDDLEILVGDFFHLDANDIGEIHAVYDRASLIALPPEMRPDYVQHLHSLLADGTQTLLVTMEYEQSEMNGPPFAVHEDEVRALYANSSEIEHLLTLDILEESPRFKERGMTHLAEKVYQLKL